MELQSRLLSGEQLSALDERWLLQWLEAHPAERADALQDMAIDSALRCLRRTADPTSVEQFVRSTVGRATDAKRAESPEVVVTQRSRPRGRLTRTTWSVVAACVAIVATICVGSFWLRDRGPGDMPGGQFAHTGNGDGFARIVNASHTVWKSPHSDGQRLQHGQLTLAAGLAEIHFDKGTVVSVTGPATFMLKSPDEMLADGGDFSIQVPSPAVGFTVETPVARIIDLGTEFDVLVDESGATETRVRQGVVTFEPRLSGTAHATPIELTADGLDHASASIPEVASDLVPVSATASGKQGQFFGAVYADGKTVEFDSREEFDRFNERVQESLKADSAGFRRHWRVMVRTTPNSTSTTVESSVGSSIGNGALDGFPDNKAQDMLLEQLRSMQQRHQDNPQMQELIEGMIRQSEGIQEEKSE
jgi:hypothetical protein